MGGEVVRKPMGRSKTVVASKYQFGKIISGGMIGIVYLARFTKAPEDFVCIKRMLGVRLSEDNLFKALRSEIEILYKVKNVPGCIKLIDVLMDEESISLVFPYCQMGDLRLYRKKVS